MQFRQVWQDDVYTWEVCDCSGLTQFHAALKACTRQFPGLYLRTVF